MNHPISIAIDGPAGAGKSSVARAVARALDALYLDTGAMYRAFGLGVMRLGADIYDPQAVIDCIDKIDLDVRYAEGGQRLFVDARDVTDLIRTPEVSEAASAVSAVSEVRTWMVARQQRIARGHSVVMDGRDIGTVVLPDATLKIFLTASVEARARRRFLELERKGAPQSYEEVLRDMQARDHRDTHRSASPLKAASDAVTLDTSEMTQAEVVEAVLRLAEARGER